MDLNISEYDIVQIPMGLFGGSLLTWIMASGTGNSSSADEIPKLNRIRQIAARVEEA